jgi:histone-binding protein RBBP4
MVTKTHVNEMHMYHLADDDRKANTDVVLRSHDTEGYGMVWTPMKEVWVLSLSSMYDKKIHLWNLVSGSGAPVLDAH